MAATPLTETEIQTALGDLPGWRFEADRLKKTFSFGNHRDAVAFLVRMAFEAEQHNHHAEIFNVYSRVEIALGTHDAGDKVTKKDAALAGVIEGLAKAGGAT